MPAKVVDASVLAALAFQEKRADEARELLRESDLYAPDLLPYELANTAVKKIRAHPEHADVISGALANVLLMQINLFPVRPGRIVEIALRSGLSAYDAAYLCLAEELGHPLVTFDERLARKVTV